MIFPRYWKFFIESQGLIGKLTDIPAEQDVSGLGAEICWFDEEEARSESEDLFPGIIVARDGFVPVGGCDIGTGDPYFIFEKDGHGAPLYRIFHRAVREDGYDRKEAVAVVLRDYRDITKCKS